MSSFVLFRNDTFLSASNRFKSNMITNGFPESRSIELGTDRLILFSDQSGNIPPTHKAENGDFITVFGSFIYRGVSGVSGLMGFLRDFDVANFAWEGLVGTHTIIVRKSGELFLLTDGLGASKIYYCVGGNIWSNSFLAMCEITAPSTFDIQACYEYVISGSTFGDQTLVGDIKSLPANSILVISEHIKSIQLDSPIINNPTPDRYSLDDVASYHCSQLDTVFESIAANYGEKIRLSFSGGYDSRLMLAMLLRHGVKPDLYVYGHEDSEDVRIAETICKAENLSLNCINKDAATDVDPDSMPEIALKNFYSFDGWKVEHGLLDLGVDRTDRLNRHLQGQVALNGSLGEIYRNFFYRPDGPTSTGAIMSTFYSSYDPKFLSPQFNELKYRSAMAKSMRDAISATGDSLHRHQMEELYPKFRGRFWTGRDAQINQRFGTMFFPYLEHSVISNTPRIPLKYKDLGYLQGRMIAHINSRVAEYPNDYGFAFNGIRPIKYRIKTFLDTQRPPFIRKISFRLKNRHREPHDGILNDEYFSRAIDMEFPIMRNLFHIHRVNQARQYGLIAGLEYLGERYNLKVPSD